MDPRILQALRQKQGTPQDAPQGQDIGNPQFDQNPFEAIINGGQGQDMGGGATGGPHMMPGGQPMGGDLPPMGAADAESPAESTAPGEEVEDAGQKGVNPGGTKFVLGAIQQLNNFITDSTDRAEIATIRSVITLLTRLVQRDQERQNMLQQKIGQTPPAQPGQ
jgi:hypothetical protein